MMLRVLWIRQGEYNLNRAQIPISARSLLHSGLLLLQVASEPADVITIPGAAFQEIKAEIWRTA